MNRLEPKIVKELDETQNPKHQRSGEALATQTMSVAVPKTDQWAEILRGLRHNAAEQGASLGHVFRSALLEYYDRHAEGNPVISLEHWTNGLPLSKAAEEKLAKQQEPPPKPRKRPDFKTWDTENLLRYFDSGQITPGDKLEIGQILRARNAYPKKPDYGLPLHRHGSG